MKKLPFLIVFATAIFINPTFATAAKPLDKVVAVVNSDVITQQELNKALFTAEKQLEQSNTPLPQKSALQKQVLNQLINRKLELQAAERMHITVTDEKVDETINTIAQKNKMTPAQLREALKSEGINYADYRKQIKEQMTIQQLIQATVGSNITITEQDIRNAKNTSSAAMSNHSQYHLSDILISLPEEPSSTDVQEAYALTNSVKAQLAKGEDFRTVAAANSGGNEALQGGDLGWRSLEEMPAIFAEKVPKMKVGEVVGPIRADNGLHIIKLEEVKNDDNTDHFITETHVRHILIKTNLPSDDQPAKQQLLGIRTQIVNGADFATMAKQYSQDAGSAQKGGDIGWPTPGMLVPPFEQAMDSLPLNEISQPVKTSYGWHLIQVLGRRKVDNTEQFKKNQIKQMIYQRELEENTEVWIQQLRHDSYVKIM
jgi:peptidyl-prolyl cis-trans isomerase SurA